MGSILIVQILFVSYGSLYDLPDLETNINILYTSVSFNSFNINSLSYCNFNFKKH